MCTGSMVRNTIHESLSRPGTQPVYPLDCARTISLLHDISSYGSEWVGLSCGVGGHVCFVLSSRDLRSLADDYAKSRDELPCPDTHRCSFPDACFRLDVGRHRHS